ncbi:ester cyclase [Sphingomonas sp. H39-1-10]|uniref:ester cyclase n=1 Tax=Sphingomonas pollutisoli TaxID=3030829 RepID=UPI0023B98407|nr:ester cyclase [Sphingomonas pollutisoli]MDF0490130.1 ester cyclase [Sphingomonas pollutisoli]
MSDTDVTRALFDRWERVWSHGELDLVPTCVAPHYLRHEEGGDRIVTPESYAAEIVALKRERPDFLIVAYDYSFQGNRAWYRVAMRWTDRASGALQTRAAMQAYRIEDGKLAETWVMSWPVGSSWPDAAPLERWTSPVSSIAGGA